MLPLGTPWSSRATPRANPSSAKRNSPAAESPAYGGREIGWACGKQTDGQVAAEIGTCCVRNAGACTRNATGRASLVTPIPPRVTAPVIGAEVTVEPSGGRQAPSGRTLLVRLP